MKFEQRKKIQTLSLRIYGTKSGWQGIRDRHGLGAEDIIRVLESMNKKLKGGQANED